MQALDNIVIHSYPNSEYIAKAMANFRRGNKIIHQVVMKDVPSIMEWLERRPEFKNLPVKIITHN